MFRFNLSFGLCFCPEIETRIMLITPTKKTIHTKSSNFNEKFIDVFQ